MHLDYRFYAKIVNNTDQWRDVMNNITIEALDGEEYTLWEISKQILWHVEDQAGMIFDTVTADEDEAYIYIHDYLKSESFFERLTQYLAKEVIDVAGDNAYIIADLTDYDTDMMGDRLFYYLGGGEIREGRVEGPKGLDHHDIEISNFKKMLKYETLSSSEQKKLKALK